MRVVRSHLLPAFLSVVAHAGLALVGAVVVARGLSNAPPLPRPQATFTAPPVEGPIIIDLPVSTFTGDAPVGPTQQQTAVAAPSVQLAGGAKVAHVDGANGGKGGELAVAEKARNLAPRAEESTLVSAIRDDVDKEQENRLLTAKERKTLVDRRMALEPMELTFVASGKGFRFERHPVAAFDAALGIPGKAAPSVAGGPLGQGAFADGDGALAKTTFGGATFGSTIPHPAKGAVYGSSSLVGAPQIVGAAVVKARPHVDKGKPSVTAELKGSPSDTVDGDQAVAAAMKTLVSTSTAGAPDLGAGKGGSGGGGAPAAGASKGEGLASKAFGEGNGSMDAPREQRRTRYFLDLQKRLSPLVATAFPREKEIELRSGTVIVDLTISKAGGVIDVIVVRPSGFHDFDQNVLTAIRSAKTFEPVPDLLGSGAITVRVPVHGGWRLQ